MSDDLAELARQVRRLIDATVANQAPPEALRAAARSVEDAVARLQQFLPDPPPPRYPAMATFASMREVFPFDVVLGPFNPLAVPVDVEWQDPLAIGRATFGTPYEGPPGCLHGGVIASVFDQVLNAANLMRGVPGPTRTLEIRYRKPTPLRRELRFEGWHERVDGREVHSCGRLLAGDVVTAEARGVFVQVSTERIMRLLSPAGFDDEPSSDR